MKDILAALTELSDDHLATPVNDIISSFIQEDHTEEETIYFLRDMRDLCVHGGAASSMVMGVFATLIPDTESDEEAEARREDLLNRYSPKGS